MKVASPVREGVVGNVPKGNALATYFTPAVALRGKKSKMREVFFYFACYASQQRPLIHTLANTVRNLWERPSCPAFSPLNNRKEFF